MAAGVRGLPLPLLDLAEDRGAALTNACLLLARGHRFPPMTTPAGFRGALSYASASPQRFACVRQVADRAAEARPSFEGATLKEPT